MSSVQDIEADVIIIGSGVAGAMSACRLIKRGVSVVILEAGPRIERGKIVKAITSNYKLDYSGGYPNVSWAPRPDWSTNGNNYIEHIGPQVTNLEYQRVVGGTTWQWNGSCVRLLPVEFRMASAYNVGVDWPIDYNTIEPFYCEAEKEMGVAGDSSADYGAPRSRPFPLPPMPLTYADTLISKALEKSGVSFLYRPVARNTRPYDGRSACEGFGTCAPICPVGAQYSAITHVEKAEKSGARVLENARVDRLLADSSGRIVAASGARSDGSLFTAKGKTFVLAANGMESPRLLMMSADEHYPKGLANGSGLLGRNFMDHPGVLAQFLMPEPVFPGRGPHSTMTCYNFRDSPARNKRAAWLMSINNPTRLHDIANDLLAKGLEPPALDSALRDRVTRQVEMETQMELLPRPENGMSLDWSKRDSAGQPHMRLYYSYSDYEQAGFKHIHETFAHIGRAMKAELLQITKDFGHYHPMGMTGMGNDPKTSVVDAHCRSHDHPNLFILSSSVFPTAGTANPTVTIAALSLRAADEIARRLGGKG